MKQRPHPDLPETLHGRDHQFADAGRPVTPRPAGPGPGRQPRPGAGADEPGGAPAVGPALRTFLPDPGAAPGESLRGLGRRGRPGPVLRLPGPPVRPDPTVCRAGPGPITTVLKKHRLPRI